MGKGVMDMNVWKPETVEVEPYVELTNWAVVELTSELWDGSSVHFVGYNVKHREGRVSSPVMSYNVVTKVGITRSGRRYKLTGTPGLNQDASYVFGTYKRINKVETVVGLTDDFV
jgi:hypothetical protein